jgi:hypothetical protein
MLQIRGVMLATPYFAWFIPPANAAFSSFAWADPINLAVGGAIEALASDIYIAIGGRLWTWPRMIAESSVKHSGLVHALDRCKLTYDAVVAQPIQFWPRNRIESRKKWTSPICPPFKISGIGWPARFATSVETPGQTVPANSR